MTSRKKLTTDKVVKTTKVHNQRGCISRQKPKVLNELTPTEQEVLIYLTNDFLTEKQIAVKRHTTQQATNKTVQILREKGIINAVNRMVVKTRGTSQPTTSQPAQPIRLHGQEFNIKLIYKDERYVKLSQKSNSVFIDGNRVMLYKNSIEVYSGQMFYGETPQSVTSKSFVYWNHFFTRLENDFKIIILKDRYQNIKLVNHHYAEVHNEFAKKCNIDAEKIRITATEDGKLWFLIDNSFNLDEMETVHPQTAKQDMENVLKHINDFRDNSPPTNSQITTLLYEMLKVNKETASGLNAVVQLISGGLPTKQTETKPSVSPWYIG